MCHLWLILTMNHDQVFCQGKQFLIGRSLAVINAHCYAVFTNWSLSQKRRERLELSISFLFASNAWKVMNGSLCVWCPFLSIRVSACTTAYWHDWVNVSFLLSLCRLVCVWGQIFLDWLWSSCRGEPCAVLKLFRMEWRIFLLISIPYEPLNSAWLSESDRLSDRHLE